MLREIENILNMAGTDMAQRCRRDREGAYEMLARMSLTGGGGVEKRRKSKTTVAPAPGQSLPLSQSQSLPQEPARATDTGVLAPWPSTAAATATGCELGFAL